MSLFFGVWGRDGRPAESRDLDLMRQAHAQWPSDASALWQAGEIGLGRIQRYHIPEAPYEVFPQASACGRHTMVSYARLDNREELLDLLKLPREQRAVTPDTTLLLLAYQRWGEACVEHLAGDWACAIWSPQERRLFLAIAPTGNDALYYSSQGSRFAFSSTPQGLLALPWVSKAPDLRAVGFLFLGAADMIAGSGFFKEIAALRPGHVLVADADRLEIRRYWQPQVRSSLRLKDDREYFEAFQAQYRRAVTCRLRSYHGVGATLSGGLDSGSVVALAAQALKAEGRTLPAFTAVPRFDLEHCISARVCGDETPYVQATAEMAGNVEVNFLPSAELTPAGSIAALTKVYGAPIFGAANSFWMLDLMQAVQRNGLRVLLTGQGGNATVSWNGSSDLWDYLDGSSPAQAWLAMARWLRGHGIVGAGKIVIRGALPTAARLGMARLQGHRTPAQAFVTYSPLRREFMETLSLKQHFDSLDAMIVRGSSKIRLLMLEASCSLAGRSWVSGRRRSRGGCARSHLGQRADRVSALDSRGAVQPQRRNPAVAPVRHGKPDAPEGSASARPRVAGG